MLTNTDSRKSVFAHRHCNSILPSLAEGGNAQVDRRGWAGRAMQVDKGDFMITLGTRRGITGETSAKHSQRRQNPAAAEPVGYDWISVADQKRGFEAVLRYQGMSRVNPGRYQTTTREARKRSWIRMAYGGRRTSNIQHQTPNIERPGKATQSHIKAISKLPVSHLQRCSNEVLMM
jgi:hypothetical protein